MKRTYLVRIEGRNVLVFNADENKLQKLGFFTTRFVEAQTSEAATTLAVRGVEDELASKGFIRNDALDPPAFNVEWVREADDQAPERGKGGFTFYPEEAH